MLQFSHISTNVKLVLHGLNWREWLAWYLDAVIVHVNSFDNHLCNIRYVLIRSRQHNLKLKQKNGVCSKRCYRFFGQGGQWGWCIRDHGENILCSSMALPTKSKRYGYFFRAHELSQGTHRAQLWLCLDTISQSQSEHWCWVKHKIIVFTSVDKQFQPAVLTSP